MVIQVTFYGHHSLHLDFGDHAIFINPIFSERVLFFQHVPISLPPPETIKKTSAVLLSAGDYAHCDMLSFKYCAIHTPFFIPKGLRMFITNHIPNPVTELSEDYHTTPFDMSVRAWPIRKDWTTFRPLRGCDRVNLLCRYRGKTFLFVFNEPSASDLAAWQRESIDIAFISLGEALWNWPGRTHAIPPWSHRAVVDLSHADCIIPIGWGGYTGHPDLATLLPEWRGNTESSDKRPQHAILLVGDSLTLE